MSQEEVNAKAKQAVLKYDVKGAKAAAQQAVDEKLDLVQVINDGFTAGIQEVGELFEAKKLYLPHIMAAANAMNAGVDILTPEIEKSGANTGEGLGKFVICTIEGDIHSIGKDIVAIMLKVAGFDVGGGNQGRPDHQRRRSTHHPAVGRRDRSRCVLRERPGLRRQIQGEGRPVSLT